MNMEQSTIPTTTSDAAEPRAARRAVPVWLLILMLLLLYWSMLYFDQHGGWFSQEVYQPFKSYDELASLQPKGEGIDLQRGKVVFENICALCHNPDGMGKPNQGPPLAGSEWVMGPPMRLIRIPLFGLNGPIAVHGQQLIFPSGMPAMGAALPEDDLAAVLTYMRQAWGNKAPAVTTQQIKAVKDQVGNRSQPFSPEEILQVPEK